MRVVFLMILGVALFTSCVQNKKKEAVKPLDTEALLHQITVDSVLQTSNYTYLKVTEQGRVFWMAVTKQEASVGDKYYYDNPLEMRNFKSKSLNRVFDPIYFVQDISKKPIEHNNTSTMNPMGGMQSKGKVVTKEDPNIHLKVADGGISIADLYASRDQYSGKTVKVSGQVVKVNNSIMGRNWIHIQDGTKSGDSYDLAVTSQETAKVGDVITVSGTIALNKDFGAGYFYEVIMESATILK